MLLLVLGLALFTVTHLVPAAPAMRSVLRDRMGTSAYLLVFSILSLVSLILIGQGYSETRTLGRANPQLWVPPAYMKHVAMTLMLPAFVLLSAAYVPSRIRTAVKHPMLAAIKLWALAHLLVRGDLASVLLFGSMLAYGVYDRISVKKRGALGPLGAAQGTARGDMIAIAIGLTAYAAMLFWGHGALIGVALVRTGLIPALAQ
jgi:uncharacterized membrane protein